MSEFKEGMRVRIKGDSEDYTDHLDGKIGTILTVHSEDCFVQVDGDSWSYYIWFRNMIPLEPSDVETPKYTREDTFVINLQLTNIFKRTDGDHEALDNETIGENIRGLIERLIAENCDEPFDDIKVTGVQKFERDLVNSNEG